MIIKYKSSDYKICNRYTFHYRIHLNTLPNLNTLLNLNPLPNLNTLLNLNTYHLRHGEQTEGLEKLLSDQWKFTTQKTIG